MRLCFPSCTKLTLSEAVGCVRIPIYGCYDFLQIGLMWLVTKDALRIVSYIAQCSLSVILVSVDSAFDVATGTICLQQTLC